MARGKQEHFVQSTDSYLVFGTVFVKSVNSQENCLFITFVLLPHCIPISCRHIACFIVLYKFNGHYISVLINHAYRFQKRLDL